MIITNDLEAGSYPGWKLYFPTKSFRESSEIVDKVEIFENYAELYSNYEFEEIARNYNFEINVKDLMNDQHLISKWQSFKNDLRFKPTETMAIVSLAVHNIISKHKNTLHKKIFVRPIDYNRIVDVKSARDMTNEMIKVDGTIFSQSEVECSAKMMCFKCLICQTELVVIQNPEVNNGKPIYPSKCKRGCTARGNFRMILSSPYTIFQPQLFIKIQDASDSSDKRLEVELIQNYCDPSKFVIGSKVACTGVIKFKSKKFSRFSKKGEAGGNVTEYLKCFHIDLIESKSSTLHKKVTENEMDVINTLKAEQSIFRVLVQSLAPDIFGREEVKAGLLLVLLSGKAETLKRAESHILLIGNPGNGKSQLLLACAEISSNGHYVNGPTATAVALTASVCKSEVKAGTFITANGGVCCIDELDKMQSQNSQSLLECMEGQTVSFTKHGARGQLPARVSIIAAANPVSSYYNRDKTLAQNVKISPPILSRFDLIFVLIDQPKSKDNEYLAHFNQRKNQTTSGSSFISHSSRTSHQDFDHSNLNWLKVRQDEEIYPLELSKLKCFVKYARENIHPEMSLEAKVEISKFYFTMMEDPNCHVTTRNLEGLIRLVIARARADLCNEATQEHAIDVINLVKFSKSEAYDDSPAPDIDGEMRPPVSKRPKIGTQSIPKQIKALYEFLREQSDTYGRNSFKHSELRLLAKEIEIERSYEEVIYRLNAQGYILKTADGYRIVKC